MPSAVRDPGAKPSAPEIRLDPDRAADDLVRLVLALVETVRQLVERQAVRRVEAGSLSEEDIERLGLTLLRLEGRMGELKAQFGLEGDDLALRFGSLQELVEEAGHG